jgi:hypothetical protein
MFKDEIEINQFKKKDEKNRLILTFETSDFYHERGTKPITMKKTKLTWVNQ